MIVCHKKVLGTDKYQPGGSCKECGHTLLVHAGVHNPGLFEFGCALCVLLAEIERKSCSCSHPPGKNELHSVPCLLFGTDHYNASGRT